MTPNTATLQESWPLTDALTYWDEEGRSGQAAWRSVDRSGACIQLAHYITPGRPVGLCFADPAGLGGSRELHARVVWCSRVDNGAGYVAGIGLLQDPADQARPADRETVCGIDWPGFRAAIAVEAKVNNAGTIPQTT